MYGYFPQSDYNEHVLKVIDDFYQRYEKEAFIINEIISKRTNDFKYFYLKKNSMSAQSTGLNKSGLAV